jgi:ribose transport system substrate-binding protein
VKHRVFVLLALVVVVSLVFASMTTATAQGKKKLFVVIGKSVHPYWSNVELGVRAAAKDLKLPDDQVVFFVPPKEDVAAQIQQVETYTAQGATGIALAPSDPNALEPVMKKAVDKGIFVTTLDTPPVKDSVSMTYIGTDNFTAGQMAGYAMLQLLPSGGKIGIGRGSDTALNALQRTDGFKDVIGKSDMASKFTILEPVNDKEDMATAVSLAGAVLSANPDLAGAFGVYAYNGPAWATALGEAKKAGTVKLVSFDATTDIINFIKTGAINATIAQREYMMGYKSVMLLNDMADMGADKALEKNGVVNGVIDTGVDVVTAGNLLDYAKSLDDRGQPHDWSVKDWTPPKDAFVFVMPQPAATPAATESK